MKKPLVVVLAVLALVAAACGSDKKSDNASSGSTGTTQTTKAAAAAGPTIQVDNKAPDFQAGFLAYFPKVVKVHPGDNVTFHNNFSGEPHTVTFGTLVNDALAAAKGADPNGPPPAAVAKLPDLLPQGPGDANQTAAKPCIVATGDLPKNGETCSGADKPFAGTEAFFNSGYLAPTIQNFDMKLADNIAPGTYGYYCLLHGTDMSGSLEVVAKDTAVPDAAAVTKQGNDERDAALAKVKDAVAALPQGTVPALGFIPPSPTQVFAGSGADDPIAPGIEEFGPKQIKVPVGGAVTWIFLGPHTVSFNAPADAKDFLVKGSDGGYHVNDKANAPAGGPGVEGPSGPPPQGPPPPPKIVDGGSFDGTGFRSTGVVLSFPPALSGYKLTFTKAGTYGYVCLVHPGMFGTVQVS
jgi:plastocyanin